MKKLLFAFAVLSAVACKKDKEPDDLPCRNCSYTLDYKSGTLYPMYTAARLEQMLNTGDVIIDKSGLQFPPKIEPGNTLCNYLDTSKVLIKVQKICY